jgi:hypothetical protein
MPFTCHSESSDKCYFLNMIQIGISWAHGSINFKIYCTYTLQNTHHHNGDPILQQVLLYEWSMCFMCRVMPSKWGDQEVRTWLRWNWGLIPELPHSDGVTDHKNRLCFWWGNPSITGKIMQRISKYQMPPGVTILFSKMPHGTLCSVRVPPNIPKKKISEIFHVGYTIQTNWWNVCTGQVNGVVNQDSHSPSQRGPPAFL